MYLRDSEAPEIMKKLVTLIEVFDSAINVTNEQHLCYLIKEHHLTWEQCNSELLKSKDVWIALLPHMPIEATIRNLGRMTKNGLFAENSEDEQIVRNSRILFHKIMCQSSRFKRETPSLCCPMFKYFS